jgi:hypothetical protein
MTQATTVYLRGELADLLTELRPTDLTVEELRGLVAILAPARRRLRTGTVIRLPVGWKSHRRQLRESAYRR